MFRTEGYVPTCYYPVCRSPCGALDLHVLGLPPAFALSQDQTLKLEENFSRLITTFDEVPRLPTNAGRTHDLHRTHACRLHDKVLPETSTAEVSSGSTLLEDRSSTEAVPAGTPPSTFLFLPIHLSNSPGSRRSHPLGGPREPPKPRASDWDRKPGHRVSVRCFEDAPSHRGGGVPKVGI